LRFLLHKLDQFFPITNPNIEIPIRGQNNPIEAFLLEMPTGHIVGLTDASPTIREPPDCKSSKTARIISFCSAEVEGSNNREFPA